MTTFNLRVEPKGDTKNKQAEERVNTLVGGHPKLHIRSHTDNEVVKMDIDFAPENKSVSGGSTRGIMRGAR